MTEINKSNKQIDPICGMMVDPKQSQYNLPYQGKLYLFCSAHCLEKFKINPEQYIQSAPIQKEMPLSKALYTCPMHPQIQQDHPGNCPICGMTLEIKNIEAEVDDSEYRNMRLRFWVGAALSIPVLLLAMSSMIPAWDRLISPTLSRWLQFILSTPVILWAGWPFFERGWYSVVNRKLNMFSLISLGVGVAYLYSVIAFFFPHLFPSSFLHQGEVPIYFETAAIITV